jgi:hypothetical protein
VRLVELAEPNRHVAANDDRTIASLDDDHCKPRVWPGAGTSRSPGSSSSVSRSRWRGSGRWLRTYDPPPALWEVVLLEPLGSGEMRGQGADHLPKVAF